LQKKGWNSCPVKGEKGRRGGNGGTGGMSPKRGGENEEGKRTLRAS